jgi:hypothetical protein
MASIATSNHAAGSPDGFVCPDCGRTFARPAALGAHRHRVHGIAGTSQNARSRRAARALRGEHATLSVASSGARTGGATEVNRDALLEALFPAGIPPRQDVVHAIGAWLDEAERITRLARA